MIDEALVAWYRANGRDLPWRSTTDPWPILVSEVMSQQTQISRVIPAWHRFMGRFPHPNDLASASTAELIELWAGLGYQRRALNLRRAAIVISRSGWPTTATELETLPGVGPYTAAAVACFAFGQPVAAIDTNLRRVLSRWAGEPLAGAALVDAARRHLDERRAAEWNQAIMDLAAMVCRPSGPRCDDCPVSEWCADPGIYVPPPRQSPYQGSVRQARAAVLKALARNPAEISTLAAVTGTEPARVERAVAALVAEGVIESRDGVLRLVDS